MKIYNELESLGFFEWLSETHNLKDTDMTPECLDELPLNDIHRTVCNSMAFRWFREKYGIKHMIFAGKISTVFYGYDLLHIEEQEFVVNNSDNGGGDCDYTTYEEAEQACLIKLIEICKTKNNEQTN
jgi:hypothetical protein